MGSFSAGNPGSAESAVKGRGKVKVFTFSKEQRKTSKVSNGSETPNRIEADANSVVESGS